MQERDSSNSKLGLLEELRQPSDKSRESSMVFDFNQEVCRSTGSLTSSMCWDSQSLLQHQPLCILIERCVNARPWNGSHTRKDFQAPHLSLPTHGTTLISFTMGEKKKVVSISQERIGSKSQSDGWWKETEGKREEI